MKGVQTEGRIFVALNPNRNSSVCVAVFLLLMNEWMKMTTPEALEDCCTCSVVVCRFLSSFRLNVLINNFLLLFFLQQKAGAYVFYVKRVTFTFNDMIFFKPLQKLICYPCIVPFVKLHTFALWKKTWKGLESFSLSLH